MSDSNDFREILEETCEFLRKAGKGPRRVVILSPEVAERVDAIATRPSALAVIEREVAQCAKCALSQTRTNTVFGSGNPNAAILFVGEAPGEDEDRQGQPFVGRAGQLLTEIIEKGIKIRRSEVYICNVLKCRPPGNRDPLPQEKDLCEPYLVRQIEAIRPKVIVALGAHAAHTLLKNDIPIGRLRGVWHFYHGIPLRATYHPAYLLRSPKEKTKCWEDIKEAIKVYRGEATPQPG